MFKVVYHGQKQNIITYLKSFHLASSKINFLVDNHKCLVNNINVNRNYELTKGDNLTIDLSMFSTKKFKPVKYPLDVLYEDDYLLIIDKPKNVIVYDDTDKELSCANYVQAYLGPLADVRHCHRLDKGTTGCLVYAKDILTHALMTSYFENHLLKKEYLAIISGIIENAKMIDLPIGRNRHDARKMMVSKTGKPAQTFITPLKVVNGNTIAKVSIKNGRTHQIRVHLSHLNHPLVGDCLYGNSNVDNLALRCYHLSFNHPISGEKIDVYAENIENIEEKRILKNESI